MPKFIATRHFSLTFLGEEWKDCFIIFRSLSVNEARELMKQKLTGKDPAEIITVSLNLLKTHFIKGTAVGEGNQIVKLTKEDLADLPAQILEKAVLFLVGGTSSEGAQK